MNSFPVHSVYVPVVFFVISKCLIKNLWGLKCLAFVCWLEHFCSCTFLCFIRYFHLYDWNWRRSFTWVHIKVPKVTCHYSLFDDMHTRYCSGGASTYHACKWPLVDRRRWLFPNLPPIRGTLVAPPVCSVDPERVDTHAPSSGLKLFSYRTLKLQLAFFVLPSTCSLCCFKL